MSPIWFPREEYEARFEVLRAQLDRQNLDGLLIGWDTNIRYYTGFRSATAFGSGFFLSTALRSSFSSFSSMDGLLLIS